MYSESGELLPDELVINNIYSYNQMHHFFGNNGAGCDFFVNSPGFSTGNNVLNKYKLVEIVNYNFQNVTYVINRNEALTENYPGSTKDIYFFIKQ